MPSALGSPARAVKILAVLVAVIAMQISGTAPILPGSPGSASSSVSSARLQRAIRKSVDYLVRRQQRGVGCWGTQNRLALTSMATLAIMSSGNTPRRGPYAENVQQAVRWILGHQVRVGTYRHAFWDEKNGYSDIHNHGYALLALTQAYGESGQELDLRMGRAIRLGIRASVESQHPNGGFGYFIRQHVPPSSREMYRGDEASTTISQIQALRGARNAGFEIPAGMIEKAERYIFRSQHKPTGGFIYSLKNGRVSFKEGSNTPTFAITAASACVLNALGTYRGPSLERAIQYMEQFVPPADKEVHFFYYGHFYAAQVMHQIGGERGRRWRDKVLKELLERQRADGSFPRAGDSHVPGDDGTLLNTAWSLQIMTMDQGVLPIHER